MTAPDAPAEARESEPGTPFAPAPRLGIIHLLVWTACVAAYLGVRTAIIGRPSELTEEGQSLALLQTAFALGAGTAVAGPLMAIVSWRKRKPFPIHPGDLLWVAQGVVAILGLLLAALVSAASFEHGQVKRPPDWSGIVVLFVVDISAGSALAFLAAWQNSVLRRWRWFFLLLAFFSSCHCCCPYGFPFLAARLGSYGTGLVSGVVLLGVVVKDLREGAKYPWTHWTGVGLAFWGAALHAIFYAVARVSWLEM